MSSFDKSFIKLLKMECFPYKLKFHSLKWFMMLVSPQNLYSGIQIQVFCKTFQNL